MHPSLVEFLRPLKKSSYASKSIAVLYHSMEYEGAAALTSTEIKAKFKHIRDKAAEQANISDVLSRVHTQGFAETLSAKRDGKLAWRLTASGKAEVRKLLGIPNQRGAVDDEIAELTTVTGKLTNDMAREFLFEAIKCLKADAHRAAVVFVWSGTVRVIQERLMREPLTSLNAALKKQNPKAREIKVIDDFAFINDATTLLVARDLGLFDKGQHTILGHGLDLRNQCGHPSRYVAGLNKVKVFIEEMIQLVFGRFA